ncbi:MAG: YdiU family protein [Proteobacteria bacterium]|nr:YdiU family protein [Pseudomonadota bacterium]
MYYNNFTEKLLGEKDGAEHPHIVEGAHYSRVWPQPAPAPKLVHCSRQMARELGWDEDYYRSEEFLQIFCGNHVPKPLKPYATCYGGHQFGVWAGQLGDGRAINLGEARSGDGKLLTLQLKGAGPTPYSRTADGYAVLRSSLREYLCSEAMHALGVPTTRALSLCLTGRAVVRDILYQGDPRAEPGAVVCRVSASFLRFGHFQLFASRGDHAGLRQLIEFSIRENFSDIAGTLDKNPTQAYLDWYARICSSTADLVVHWQRVGFVHGVLNTDNMSVLGETVDYGPYGWMEEYNPAWTPNTTDTGSRYCFVMQGKIALWNLWQLACALSCVVADEKSLEAILNNFMPEFEQRKLAMMRAKLGLSGSHPDDADLCATVENFMQTAGLDMTLFFTRLGDIDGATDSAWAAVEAVSYRQSQLEAQHKQAFLALMERYFARLALPAGDTSALERTRLMNAHNPVFVPRNYLAQQAIEAAEKGSFDELTSLFAAAENPHDHQTPAPYTAMRPAWALSKPGCSMLSCSS